MTPKETPDDVSAGAAWDQNYRRLDEGEVILSTDECQRDDGSWIRSACVGERAPDPNYTSHRVYRRKLSAALAQSPTPLAHSEEREAEVSEPCPLCGSPDARFERDGACPICRRIDGCNHTIRERINAALRTPNPAET